MRELLPICIFSFLLASFDEYIVTNNTVSEGKRQKKMTLPVLILALSIGAFCGLRTAYNDTANYIDIYEYLTATDSAWSTMMLTALGDNPGFGLINSVLKYLGFSTQSFFMFYAIVTNVIYIWFVKKYSVNFAWSYFLFITMGCYTFTMAAVKQCLAVALCLVATDRAINKKYISFVVIILMAMTIHPYAAMYLVVPFLDYKPWSMKTLLSLIGFGFTGIFLNRMLDNIISITSLIGEGYDASYFIGDGVNILRLAVVWAPIFLALLGAKLLEYSDNRANNIIINLMILNGSIMFVAFFGNPIYFARLANYFLIFQTLALPIILIECFEARSARIVAGFASVGYLVFFYYENMLAHGTFDDMFSRITLSEYLHSLFLH